MSYYETIPGAGKHGFTEGMGAAFPGPGDKARTPNEELRAIQQNLQRMGLLEPGTGARGADGLIGLYTLSALTKAKERLGRTAAPFKPTNASKVYTIPDDFVVAIQAAADAASSPGTALLNTTNAPTSVSPTAVPDPSTTLPDALVSPPLPPVVQETTPSSNTRLYLIGGSIAVVAVGAAAYMLWPRKKVTPNRFRRARR